MPDAYLPTCPFGGLRAQYFRVECSHGYIIVLALARHQTKLAACGVSRQIRTRSDELYLYLEKVDTTKSVKNNSSSVLPHFSNFCPQGIAKSKPQ